jgi:HIV Tat-specific factor 1
MKKRKKAGEDTDYTSNQSTLAAASSSAPASAAASTSAAAPARPPRQAPHSTGPKKTGVFVSNLPFGTTVAKLADVFSKAGVLLIGDDGEPRIKLYTDAEGRFKGEALVIYFKEGSVDLAVRLLDDTELEVGAGEGNMRVKEAEYGDGWSGDKKEATNGTEEKPAEAKAEGGAEADKPSVVPGTGAAKRTYTAEEKQRMTKRIKAMQK